jgi:hypothetical protein
LSPIQACRIGVAKVEAAPGGEEHERPRFCWNRIGVRGGEMFGERMMPLREPVPCPIRVRGATEKSAGEHCDASEQRLERRNSAWAHAAARRAIERVFA